MSKLHGKRMKRVLNVMMALRKLEEARMGELHRRTEKLKSAQADALVSLNSEDRFGGSFSNQFADLIATQLRSLAGKEHEASALSLSQRERLARRQAQEKMTENQVTRLNRAAERSNRTAELYEVIDSHIGKPPASPR
ncbi:MAG: hypothetical protein ACR2OM_14920 [Aestuariivirgaceae bacterium]